MHNNLYKEQRHFKNTVAAKFAKTAPNYSMKLWNRRHI